MITYLKQNTLKEFYWIGIQQTGGCWKCNPLLGWIWGGDDGSRRVLNLNLDVRYFYMKKFRKSWHDRPVDRSVMATALNRNLIVFVSLNKSKKIFGSMTMHGLFIGPEAILPDWRGKSYFSGAPNSPKSSNILLLLKVASNQGADFSSLFIRTDLFFCLFFWWYFLRCPNLCRVGWPVVFQIFLGSFGNPWFMSPCWDRLEDLWHQINIQGIINVSPVVF